MTLDQLYRDRPAAFRADLAKAEHLRRTNPELATLTLPEVLRVMNSGALRP